MVHKLKGLLSTHLRSDRACGACEGACVFFLLPPLSQGTAGPCVGPTGVKPHSSLQLGWLCHVSLVFGSACARLCPTALHCSDNFSTLSVSQPGPCVLPAHAGTGVCREADGECGRKGVKPSTQGSAQTGVSSFWLPRHTPVAHSPPAQMHCKPCSQSTPLSLGPHQRDDG